MAGPAQDQWRTVGKGKSPAELRNKLGTREVTHFFVSIEEFDRVFEGLAQQGEIKVLIFTLHLNIKMFSFISYYTSSSLQFKKATAPVDETLGEFFGHKKQQ